jgi:hypothetical protein
MLLSIEEQIYYWNLIKDIGSFNDKWADIVAIKSEIFSKLILSFNSNAKDILFVSFNPICVNLSKQYNVTVVCAKDLVDKFDFSLINRVDNIDNINSNFDFVFALDEYLTYADNEDNQKQLLEQLAKRTNSWLITTLQDYKNAAPYKKNQIESTIFNSSNNYIVLESNLIDKNDKQMWNHYLYCIKNHHQLITIGPTARRTLYFKQLAKYASDLGSKQYLVEKNLLYKGFFSKVYEHIIAVKF